MFVVFLKFSKNKNQAGAFMEAHKKWLQKGFAEGCFLLAGGLQPNRGGAIVAHNTTLDDLQSRINNDPFVIEGVVTAEINEISASMADDRLAFLKE